jgi:hypothetical protein
MCVIDFGGGGDGDLLTHLLFFIKVIEDANLAIVEWPKYLTVEATKEFPGELLIPRDVRDKIFLL